MKFLVGFACRKKNYFTEQFDCLVLKTYAEFEYKIQSPFPLRLQRNVGCAQVSISAKL